MIVTAAALALLVAADPPPKKADPLKNAVRGALTQRDGGVDPSTLPFTPDSIKQVVQSWQPEIQACYESHLAAKEKAVEGVLKTTFTITPEGFVKNAKVNRKTSTLKDPHLHECVVAVLSNMEFPKPSDGKPQPIEFPFNLKAQH